MIDKIKELSVELKKTIPDDDMYDAMVKNLQNDNPATIQNYPHEVPFIYDMELDAEVAKFLD